VSAGDLLEDIVKFADVETRPSLENDLRESLRESLRVTLSKSVSQTLNDFGFERFFVKILRRTGADVTHLPKNDARPGDVDVRAVFQSSCPAKYETTVYYQLKQYENELGKKAIDQLLERRNSLPESDREAVELCVVTTASASASGVQTYADEHNVKIILKDELIDWLLESDLNQLIQTTN
jgi:Restriction endonuclease